MENETKQGYMARVENEDEIMYLHRTSQDSRSRLRGLSTDESGTICEVVVLKGEIIDHSVQLGLHDFCFTACAFLSASQARTVASALLVAAADSERLDAAEEVST